MSASAKPIHLHVIAFAALGPSISGGDRMFIEFSRHWSRMGHQVTIYTSDDGEKMCRNHGLQHVEIQVLPIPFRQSGFAFSYAAKTWQAIEYMSQIQLDPAANHIVYTAGDSPPDVLPAQKLLSLFPHARWMAGFYFFAPTPWKDVRDIAYRGGQLPFSFRSLCYFTFQHWTYRLIREKADHVVVCNLLDVNRMVEDGLSRDRITPIYGGVDLTSIHQIRPSDPKRYDACFVGRFHAQKGVLILLEIWAHVLRKRPGAMLAIIGEGSLRHKMEQKIQALRLQDHVSLLGFQDGVDKYRILKQSRIFVHPPTHDTGGMAAAEAMACGLPVVGFDLPGYEHSYPFGMLKARVGDPVDFADLIVKLLEQPDLYETLSREAVEYSHHWDWPQRAKILDQIFRIWYPLLTQ